MSVCTRQAADNDPFLGPLQFEDQLTTVNLTQHNLNLNVWRMDWYLR